MPYRLHHRDCFDWLNAQEPNTIHAVCTDPPYGLIEFSQKEIAKLRNGNRGGVWRIPPVIGGNRRDPLPRFTVLNQRDKDTLRSYMKEFGDALFAPLVPGAHIAIAGHPMLQYIVQGAMAAAGYEVRTAVMRLYSGFRGGDRPKNAHDEFPEVCVTPRGAYEPWMLFRKPISEQTVAENLRKWQVGGLRRLNIDKPLPEVIPSGRTPAVEIQISDHPCLKPQQFLRVLVRALLPLGRGTILDPFMGSGSTIAAAEAIGYHAIGLEVDEEYFNQAKIAIPRLASLYPMFDGSTLEPSKAELNPGRNIEEASMLDLFV